MFGAKSDTHVKRVEVQYFRKVFWSGGRPMANTYTAVVKQDGDWWIGWVEEVPGVNCQEKTREELLESLSITLKEALEFNREEAIRAAAPGYTEEPLIV